MLISLLVLIIACDANTGCVDAPGEPLAPPACTLPEDAPAAGPDAVDCSRIARIGLAGSAPRPGGGVELALRLEAADGASLDARTHGACLGLRHAVRCERLDAEPVRGVQPAAGASTALLVAPGRSPDSAASARATVEAFLASRPADERVGIFHWGARVHQVSNFSTDRALAADRAARALIASDEPPVAADVALAQVQADLAALSHRALPGMRSVVIVAPELAVDTPPRAGPEVAVVWAGTSARLPGGLPGAAPADTPTDTLANTLDARLDAHQAAGLARLAWCRGGAQDQAQDQVRIVASGSEAELLVALPPALAEEAHLPCTPALLAEPRAYPERIELVFATDAQRQTYHDRVEELSKDAFDLMLRLWPDGEAIPARAELRGKGSLECERKSYHVELADGLPRHLIPGLASREVYLIAMCMDNRYINQYTANVLAARLGLFPLGFRFIELTVDGEHRGVYLLVEQPRDALLHDNSRVRSIVRRRTDIMNEPPDPKYGFEGELEALEDYGDFLDRIRTSTGSALSDALASSLDIDQYLRWIALMTLLGNGDYIDEVYFVATETLDRNLAPADFYSIVSWDPDDLFSECHEDGFAVEDPNQLLFCTEALIDHTLFADRTIYARYVNVLAALLDAVSQDVFDAVLDETVALLEVYFRDPAVREAMIELREDNPDVIDYEEAMADIEDAAATMKNRFAERHADLRQAIEDWRARSD